MTIAASIAVRYAPKSVGRRHVRSHGNRFVMNEGGSNPDSDRKCNLGTGPRGVRLETVPHGLEAPVPRPSRLPASHAAYHDAVSTESLRVALIQTDATADVAANVARAAELADSAAADGARLVALPEYLQYRGDDDGFRASARPIPGPYTEPFCEV